MGGWTQHTGSLGSTLAMVKATVETARREVGSLNLDTRNGRLGLGDTNSAR